MDFCRVERPLARAAFAWFEEKLVGLQNPRTGVCFHAQQ